MLTKGKQRVGPTEPSERTLKPDNLPNKGPYIGTQHGSYDNGYFFEKYYYLEDTAKNNSHMICHIFFRKTVSPFYIVVS